MSIVRKIIYSTIPLIVVYAAVETVTTVLYRRGDLEPISIWVLEDTGQSTIQFDPILGYRLTETPTRMACIATNGVVESVGSVRGNNMGFPDRDDFSAKKERAGVRRFAVFGDSFSAAQFLEVNWPDRCEDLSQAAGQPVELLNLSIDGGGQANWRRTIQGFLDERDFELDGVIFAVYGNDLRRPFVIWDDRVIQTAPNGTRTIGFGTVWNQRLPTTIDEARPFFHGLPRWQVHSSESLDRMLVGKQRPLDDRVGPYLLGRVARAFSKPPSPPRQFTMRDVNGYNMYADPARLHLWDDIRRYLQRRKLPALVVDVPDMLLMLANSGPSAEAEAFSQFLDADFIDGATSFEGLTPEEIRACWLPYDAHWGQAGSDRFAEFMRSSLAKWP